MEGISTNTLPGLLIDNAEKMGDRVALREKEYGIWQEITWKQYLENVKSFSLGMIKLGLKRGDKVVFVSDNRPEWLYTELAAMCAGAVPLGMYPDSENVEEFRYLIANSDARFVMAEDQEQTDKVLAVKDKLPQIEKIIVDEIHELRNYNEPLLIGFKEVQELGRELEREQPELFWKNVAGIRPEDVAIISTTSGTTALSKLAMLSHKGLIVMARGQDELDPMYPEDQMVSSSPTAWIGERLFSLSWALIKGFPICFAEDVVTIDRDLREIGPPLMFAGPRTWDNMVSIVQVKIKDAAWLKRWIYNRFLPLGEKVAELRLAGKKVPLQLRILYVLGEHLLYKQLRDRLGLSKTRKVYTGGAPLGVDQFRFFHAIGVRMKQLYGQTEMSGISVAQRDDEIKLETVGRPIPGAEIRIAESGEIQLKGEAMLVGYYNNPEATEKAVKDGWFCSGDYGYIDDDGHLIMVDRLGDVMSLTGGTKFSPQYVETKLKYSPYIKEAVAFGDRQDYVASIIQIDMDSVGKWAEMHQLGYTTFKDLSQKPEVYELVKGEVERINQGLPEAIKVRRYSLFEKELDPEDDEITHTRKVRRTVINERYERQIKALHSEEETEVPVVTLT